MLINEIPHPGAPVKPYTHQEYPKALDPPAVIVTSRDHELQLRAMWGMPLTYDGDLKGDAHRESYFMRQVYPKQMQPPQVKVDSAEEERRQLAAWRMGSQDPVARQTWPQWRFHAEQGGKLVHSDDESAALGADWFQTPGEAIESARGQVVHPKERAIRAEAATGEQSERADLYRKLDANYVRYSKHWSTERLRQALGLKAEPAEAAAETKAA